MLVGGGRSGKTFLIVRAIMVRALRAERSRHAILRLRFNAVRASIWLDTLPKVARLCFPEIRMKEHSRDNYVELPNGSEIWLGGLDEKERVEKILGQEYASLYFNECSQIPYSSVLMARTRLAQNIGLRIRGYYDLNPVGTGHWTHRLFIQGRDPVSLRPIEDRGIYAHAFINPDDNAANLPAETLAEYRSLPDRQRRRFYEGIYQAEIDGALWTFEGIEHARCTPDQVPRDLRRVVVAIDPSGTKGDEDQRSDNVGIVVAGVGVDKTGYVLADRTCNLAPEGWARVAVAAYREFKADRIIAEQNFGGDMVRAVLHTIDPNIPVRLVVASRGKAVRAEPVSALYGFERNGEWQKDRVRHAGEFRELEDQMLNFSTAGYLGDRSPDRCIAAGTLVETARGAVPIEDVIVGDWALTRLGYREVLASRCTDHSARTMMVETTAGKLSATPDHLILTRDGWRRVDTLGCGDILWSCTTPIQHQSRLCTTALSFAGSPWRRRVPHASITRRIGTASELKGWGSFTSKFGGMLTIGCRYLTAILFTTRMVTRSIMIRAIWWQSHAGSMRLNISRICAAGPRLRRTLSGLGRSLLYGISRSRDASGTGRTPLRCGNHPHWFHAFVRNVARGLNRPIPTRGFVQENAVAADRIESEPTSTKSRAPFVLPNFGKAFTDPSLKLVPASVVRRCADEGVRPVYDLTIDKEHEFFANGHLVHNCDALVWALTELMVEPMPDEGYIEFLRREAEARAPKPKLPPITNLAVGSMEWLEWNKQRIEREREERGE